MIRIALALVLAAFLAAPVSAASVAGVPIKSSVKGEGPTIIFVHGWTCDETVWAAQVDHFDDDYRVVTLDLPGHGGTGQPQAYSMENFAAAVEAVRAELGADKVVLVGHSMGAAVIRQYALDHPDHVAGVVGVDGPLDMRVMAGRPQMDSMSLDQRRGIVGSMFVPGTSPELRAEIMDMMLAPAEVTAVGSYHAMIDPALQNDRIVSAPALSIMAADSSFATSETMREVLPDWEFETIPQTGHFLMMERPQVFNASLERFLESRAKF